MFEKSNDERRNTTVVMVCDLDNFKWINDHYGHPIGDTVLAQYSRILDSIVGVNGSVFRYGGDEFFIALDDLTAAKSARLAKNICSAAQEWVLDDGTAITTTVGATAVRAEETIKDAFSRADQALLSGKNSGSNKVVWSG